MPGAKNNLEEWDGIPIQLTADKGSEIGWQITIQAILREFYAPHIDNELYPPTVAIPSTRNTVIEALWQWLREKLGLNLRDIIICGKLEQRFRVHDKRHHDLFYWVFIPLIQHELNVFRDYWNNHKIRKQLKKAMPSGHIPADALHHPSLFRGHKCLIRIPETHKWKCATFLLKTLGLGNHTSHGTVQIFT